VFDVASPAATRRGRPLKTLTGMAAGSLWPMGIAPHKKQKFDMPVNVKRWRGAWAAWGRSRNDSRPIDAGGPG
jgi:hypothetical protein